jgi:hypothetical protein
MLRRMLREMLRWFANSGASTVAWRVANHVASFGDNIVAHSSCVRVNRPIFRQTSSLNTARGWERRRKCCAKLAQKSRERPAGKSGLRKRLIFGVLQGVSGFFNHDTIPLRLVSQRSESQRLKSVPEMFPSCVSSRGCRSSPEAHFCHFLNGTPNV